MSTLQTFPLGPNSSRKASIARGRLGVWPAFHVPTRWHSRTPHTALGAVLCHADSHIATDECGALEFFGGALELIGLPDNDSRVAAETLKRALRGYFGRGRIR